MRITRRHLQLSLAALWLLDGALQCQPSMFSRHFARTILAPASMGQPHLVAMPVHWITALVATHAALANGGFAAIQIGIGLGLLTRRLARVTLAASIAWAISIWFVGEGLGGIATGGTLLTGAPGAALLYAVIAVVAWPIQSQPADDRPSRFAIHAWCGLWLSGAALQLVAGNDTGASLTGLLRSAQSGAPAWIAGIDRHLAQLRVPNCAAATVITLYVLIGLWVLVPGWSRSLSVGIGVSVALAAWLLVQGLGDLTSGQATDPNAGPLVALLALAVVGAAPPRAASRHLSRVFASSVPDAAMPSLTL